MKNKVHVHQIHIAADLQVWEACREHSQVVHGEGDAASDSDLGEARRLQRWHETSQHRRNIQGGRGRVWAHQRIEAVF